MFIGVGLEPDFDFVSGAENRRRHGLSTELSDAEVLTINLLPYLPMTNGARVRHRTPGTCLTTTAAKYKQIQADV